MERAELTERKAHKTDEFTSNELYMIQTLNRPVNASSFVQVKKLNTRSRRTTGTILV